MWIAPENLNLSPVLLHVLRIRVTECADGASRVSQTVFRKQPDASAFGSQGNGHTIMLIWRLTLGTLIIAVLAGLCWLDWHASRPGIWLFAVACIVAGLAAMEAAALAPPPHGRAATARIVLGTLLVVALSGTPLIWPATPNLGPIGWPAVGLAAGLLVPIIGAVLAYRGPGQGRVGMAFSVFAITYVGLPLTFFIYLPSAAPSPSLAALTIATIPALTASGSSGHALTTAAKSGSIGAGLVPLVVP